jgi:hypothetical protein
MDENDPVDESEFVLRRIHLSFFDPALSTPIRAEAFRPLQNDESGLSVFRALFVQPAGTLAGIDASKAKNYYVARLEVRRLRGLGLTVEPDPIAVGPPGHAVIPELIWSAYIAQKRQWKAILVELAKLASPEIVHRPSAP